MTSLISTITKYILYKESKYYNSKGTITVFDRYPIKSIYGSGTMDAPQGVSKNSSLLSRLITKFEHHIYVKFELPDLIFLLEVNAKKTLLRRPGYMKNKSGLLEKIKVFNRIKGVKNSQIIDTGKGLMLTKNKVKKIIWSEYSKKEEKIALH